MFGNSDKKFTEEQVLAVMNEALENWDWDGDEEKQQTLKGMLGNQNPTAWMSNTDDTGLCVDLTSYKGRIDIYDYVSEKLD